MSKRAEDNVARRALLYARQECADRAKNNDAPTGTWLSGFHDKLPDITMRTEAYEAGYKAAIERASAVCMQQQQDFLSPEYSAGQPMSSFLERFACGQCAERILALVPPDQVRRVLAGRGL